MARDISTISQTNLWGKQAEYGLSLEPQRNDLYFVDFTSAVKNVAAASRVQLAPILPHYVRSVTFPELRTKAEPVRRESLPYPMPSWDDPLDPIKLVFFLEAKTEHNVSAVTSFLDAWLRLTRAGRGDRSLGYAGNWLKLNSDYKVDFQFNFNVFLLRGAALSFAGFMNDGRDAEQIHRFNAQAATAYRNLRRRDGLVQSGQPVPESLADLEPVFYIGFDQHGGLTQDMVIHVIYVFKRAWLGAYKISDLNHAESGLVTVEATFYADAVEPSEVPRVSGEASKVDNSS